MIHIVVNLHCSVQFKRLAHLLSLLISIIMAIYLLVTSSLLADLYRRFCDQDFVECEDDARNFLTIPLFGYLTMIGWVRQSVHMCVSYACDVQEFNTNYSLNIFKCWHAKMDHYISCNLRISRFGIHCMLSSQSVDILSKV